MLVPGYRQISAVEWSSLGQQSHRAHRSNGSYTPPPRELHAYSRSIERRSQCRAARLRTAARFARPGRAAAGLSAGSVLIAVTGASAAETLTNPPCWLGNQPGLPGSEQGIGFVMPLPWTPRSSLIPLCSGGTGRRVNRVVTHTSTMTFLPASPCWPGFLCVARRFGAQRAWAMASRIAAISAR